MVQPTASTAKKQIPTETAGVSPGEFFDSSGFLSKDYLLVF
jgi:hypothetical protein